MDFQKQKQKTSASEPFAVIVTFVLMMVVFGFWQFLYSDYNAMAAVSVPKIISFQGKLTDAGRITVSDTARNMKFVIYDSASGGTCLWSASNTDSNTATVDCTGGSNPGSISVTTKDGVFFVLLGDTTGGTQNTFPSTLFDNSNNLWLGISVGTDAEMTPRIRLATVPFAMDSDLLDGFDSTQSGAASSVLVSASDASVTLTGSAIFSGVATDITTGTNQALTIAPDGTGDTIVDVDADSNAQVLATAAPGVDMLAINNASNGTTTTGVSGINVNFAAATGGSGETNNGLNVSVTPSGDAGDTIRGVNIGGITGTSSTENAFRIGAGWDRDIVFGDATPVIKFGQNPSGDVLEFTDAADNVMFAVGDSGTVGQATATGNLEVDGGDLITTSTTTTTLFNSNAANFLNIGGSTNVVNLAGGSSSTGCTISVAGNLTCSGDITGGTTGTAGYWTRAGTTLSPANSGDALSVNANIAVTSSGNFLAAGGHGIDTDASSGTLAVGNTNASAVSLCNSATCDTVSIGTNTDADAITLGESHDSTSITGNTWSITTGGDITTAGDFQLDGGDINSTSATFNFLNAATDSSTINIGGVTNSRANTISIATNGTAADTLAIGNSNASTTLALTGGDDWSITTGGAATFGGTTTVNAETDLNSLVTINGGYLDSTSPTFHFLDDTGTSGTIDIGGVSTDLGNTVNIATNATTADTVTIGNTNTSTVASVKAPTLNLGITGSGTSSVVIAGGSGDTGCTIDGSSGNLTCTGAISGSGSSTTLQDAYDNGNTLSATDGRDLSLTFANTATDPNFLVNLAGDGDFVVKDNGTVFWTFNDDKSIDYTTNQTSTNPFDFTADSLNTATALNMSIGGISTGEGLGITANSTARTSGDLINASQTATYTTTHAVSGQLLDLSQALTLGTAGQTLTQNGDLATITRSTTQTAGTANVSGALLSLTNTTSGTISDTGSLLTLTQNDTGASGTGLSITDSATGSSALGITSSVTGSSAASIIANGVTNGTGLLVQGGSSMIANGELVDFDLNGATLGAAATIHTAGVYTGSGIVQLLANNATSGVGEFLSMAGLTTGTGLQITAGGATLASGGKLENLSMGAATDGNGLAIVTTGAYAGTGLESLVANSLTSGTELAVNTSAGFSGSMVSLSGTGAATGNFMNIAATGVATNASSLLNLTSSNASAAAKAISIDIDNGNNNNTVMQITTDETTVSGTAADTVKFRIDASGEAVSDVGFTAGGASTKYYDGSITSSVNALTISAPTSITFKDDASNTLATLTDAGTTGNLSVTGTTTSAALLTASNGLTQTTGALNLTATSGSIALTGFGVSSIASTATSGALFSLSDTATTTGLLTGVSLDLSGVTATNRQIQAIVDTLPAVTNTSASSLFYRGLDITGGALTHSSGAGTDTFQGIRITNSDVTQTSGTTNSTGIQVNTGSITTGGTQSALIVNGTGVGAGTLTGVNVLGITGGAGTETALSVGSGWDTDLSFADTTPTVSIGNSGTLSFTDGGNTLMTIADAGTSGNLTVTNNVTVDGIASVTSSSTTSDVFTATDSALTQGRLFNLTTTKTLGASGTADIGLISLTDAGSNTSSGEFNGIDYQWYNQATAAHTQNAMVIRGEAVGNFTDSTTESLLYLVENDNTTSGTTVVTSGLKIEATGNSGMTNGIGIVGSANMTNAINITNDPGTNYITSASFVVTKAGRIDKFTLDGTNDTTIGVCKNNADTTGDEASTTLHDCNGTPGDIAEWYETDGAVSPGEIAAPNGTDFTYQSDAIDALTGIPTGAKENHTITELTTSSAAYQSDVIGVVSTSPVQTYGKGVVDSGAAHPQPIAITGRVPLKVNDENGTIAVGDPITSSSTPGIGMKSTLPGKIVGYALEAWAGPGEGTIELWLNPSWHAGVSLGNDGTAMTVNSDTVVTSTGTADATTTAFDSHELALRGSAWDVGSSSAQDEQMNLVTDVTSPTDYRLSIKNSADTEVAYVTNEGTVRVAGDMVVGGKIYPSNMGVVQTDKYIYYDGSSGFGGDFMRTNASGWGTGSYDFAEMFPSDQKLASGDVVVFADTDQHVARSIGNNGQEIAGIVSTRPGFLAGDDAPDLYPIALAGRVPTKVTTENGPIAIGDPLTVSSKEGYAMKATTPGPIVGYALEPYDGAAKDDLIIVFVNVGYWGGNAPTQTPGTNNHASGFGSGTQDVSRLNMNGNIYMNSYGIQGIGSLAGIGNRWSVNEDGLFATRQSYDVVVESYQNTDVVTHATLSTENTISLSGSGELSGGTAAITLEDVDPTFNDIASNIAPVRVFVTLRGEANGVYVTDATTNGFTVHETMNGSHDAAFDWEVVAYRKDREPAQYLAPQNDPNPPVDTTTTDTTTGSTDTSGAGIVTDNGTTTPDAPPASTETPPTDTTSSATDTTAAPTDPSGSPTTDTTTAAPTAPDASTATDASTTAPTSGTDATTAPPTDPSTAPTADPSSTPTSTGTGTVTDSSPTPTDLAPTDAPAST